MDKENLRLALEEKVLSLQSHFSKAQLFAICFLVIALTAGGVLFYLRSRPKQILVANEKVRLSSKQEKMNTDSNAGNLFVHVSGAVKKPDVYELGNGSRVIDAIKLAGGATAEADLDVLNLAAKVNDGQKIYVPRLGEVARGQASLTSGDSGVTGSDQTALISLNTATEDQLEELPGIGPTLAQRIIDWRETHNGFSKVDELKEVEGIGPKKFESIKDKVSVD